jgi:hypothetical protein
VVRGTSTRRDLRIDTSAARADDLDALVTELARADLLVVRTDSIGGAT